MMSVRVLKRKIAGMAVSAMLMSFISVFALPLKAYASEKELKFQMTKDYDACAFSITTEKHGRFDVELFSPNDDEAYHGSIENGNTCEILVKDVHTGEWSVKVSTVAAQPVIPIAPVASEEEASEEESQDESGAVEESADAGMADLPEEPAGSDIMTSDDAEDRIGTIRISVRAIDLSSYHIDDVTVAKDITGLKMYFKDDNIEVEWADAAGENVNVSVMDTQTQLVLGEETVEGHSYECAIPEDTKQITVQLIPATSVNVHNAGSQYTLDVNYHPNAIVTYDKVEYTNKDKIPVHVTLDGPYALQMVCNGKVVQNVETKPVGEYDYEIPLVEGPNRLLVYVVDENGNMRSTPYEVIRDSVMPNLKLSLEYNGLSTYEQNVQFEGNVSDYDTFTINGSDVKVSGDGFFSHDYELHEGVNKIVFKATDLAGNEAIYTADVTMVIPEEKPIPWRTIAIGLAIVVVLVFFVIKRKKADGGDDAGVRPPKKEAPAKEKKKLSLGDGNILSKIAEHYRSMKDWQKEILLIAVFTLIGYILSKCVLIPGTIASGSMEPTLMTGDVILTNGLAYKIHDPERGDIVSFRSDEKGGIIMTKRVIGIPGDEIEFHDGYVYINGNITYESYIPGDVETNSARTFNVPEGSYFMLGDNRENSGDSRYWKNPYIPKDKLMGKYFAKIWHKDNYVAPSR